jgi:DNA segregation ATPase FtsK/SpoIIIE-like protein
MAIFLTTRIDMAIIYETPGYPTHAERLEQAKKLVIKERKASISMIQRVLQIGYNTAAHLMEDLEREGVVSAMNQNGIRKVITPTTGGPSHD